MKGKNLKTVKAILKDKGKDFQLLKLQEEATELSLSLIHLNTKKNSKERLNDVYKEFADVKIAMRIAEEFLDRKKINRLVNKKLEEKRKKYKNDSIKQTDRS